jgi:uncharacterized protein (TIGR03792 family)
MSRNVYLSPKDGGKDGVQRGLKARVDAYSYRYSIGESHPLEVLVFEMDPEHVEEFLRVDHEVYTLGQASVLSGGRIPFLSKEAWVDESRPGRVVLLYVWESLDLWDAVGAEQIQRDLQDEFEAKFSWPYRLVEAWHEETGRGLRQVSRFERETGREPGELS